jgi:phosphoserine phosphatase
MMVREVDSEMPGLVCLDMDRVLVDHLSTWQFVYDRLGINNDESFNLYNQGLLDEWDWIKLDIALIKNSWREQHGTEITDADLRACMEGMPMMKNYQLLIQSLLNEGHHVAIVSGGLQQTARDIACLFPSENKWKRRWGGIDRHTSRNRANGYDTQLHVFTNGWTTDSGQKDGSLLVQDFGRYQVQRDGKGARVQMLRRRLKVDAKHVIAVGDSAGDIGMFQEAAHAICFNPWDERPIEHANEVIHEKDLQIVLKSCIQFFSTVDL